MARAPPEVRYRPPPEAGAERLVALARAVLFVKFEYEMVTVASWVYTQ
jgi:hypothetical protein